MKSAVPLARGSVVAILVLLAQSAAPPPQKAIPVPPPAHKTPAQEPPQVGPPAPKQKPAPDGDLQAVIALEQKLWQAWKARDLATIRRLSAPEYRSVSEDGPERSVTLEDLVANFKAYRLREVTLGRMAAYRLGPDTLVVAYNARISGTFDKEDVSRDASEASVWVRREGRWLNAFLHEVTITKPKKP